LGHRADRQIGVNPRGFRHRNSDSSKNGALEAWSGNADPIGARRQQWHGVVARPARNRLSLFARCLTIQRYLGPGDESSAGVFYHADNAAGGLALCKRGSVKKQ
jgi:hypothetical protein